MKMRYFVTREFTDGTLKGLQHTGPTDVKYEVGFHCAKPVGGSPYTITSVIDTEAKNEFFDPASLDCEVIGFDEEFQDAVTGKSLGDRRLPGLPQRPTGSPGQLDSVLTEDTVLRKGFNLVTIKASKQKPRRVRSMIIILCGKKK